MTNEMMIRKAEGKWVVRAGGAVLGETSNALELTEANMPPVIYFPEADIAMPFLEAADTRIASPTLGEAQYFSIETKSNSLRDAAYRLTSPNAELDRLKGYLAFRVSDTVTVERL
ncbi:DUF427 domain-containing protein [Actibacterium sp. XHP0104]|uniref:DUF427 domain-containing protein n=1 Tax=Actibacterium sp. XHP0104 TaxID=2984335 RepID=UPI0021E79FB3|nr:DUF427 domain-containing protein [Actibacterium sp. XHP0104]MCV2881344.1 DUF427 domain-containing protein [Actibacterium sp. XHP0104]